MLAIRRPSTPSRTHTLTPNILPSAIHHNGPLKISKRYWNPQTDTADGTRTSYFRGRKLKGRSVKLPVVYRGYLLQKTEKRLEQRPSIPSIPKVEDEDEDNELMGADEDGAEEVTVMEQKGEFEEVVVWGHEVVPEEGDEYVKGIEEWMKFAEAMHTDDGSAKSSIAASTEGVT